MPLPKVRPKRKGPSQTPAPPTKRVKTGTADTAASDASTPSKKKQGPVLDLTAPVKLAEEYINEAGASLFDSVKVLQI